MTLHHQTKEKFKKKKIFRKDALNCLKGTLKTFILQNISISNKCFNRKQKKSTVFNIDHNKKRFSSTK